MRKRTLLIIICCLTLGFTPFSFAGSLDGTYWKGDLKFIFTYVWEMAFYEDYIYMALSYPPYYDTGPKRSQNTYIATENPDGSIGFFSWAINIFLNPVFYWGTCDINEEKAVFNAITIPLYLNSNCELISTDWSPEEGFPEENITNAPDILPLFLLDASMVKID